METVTRSHANGHAAQPILPKQLQVAEASISSVSLNGVDYGPPDGLHDRTAWAALVEELHDVNELSRLARALAA